MKIQMEKFKFYEVGGCVRDEILGCASKDIDYVAVPNEYLLNKITNAKNMFIALSNYLANENFKIFIEHPDMFTIRAKFPINHKYSGDADFVMARKEVGYVKNTRIPIINPGTLYDDLLRRDFTVNAIAKDDDGSYIDYFNGLTDIQNKILKTPLSAIETFNDDPLRILRAIRFSITKGFSLSEEIIDVINTYDFDEKMIVVSMERIRDELYKCFKYNTFLTIEYYNKFPKLFKYIFNKSNLWLKPTFEIK